MRIFLTLLTSLVLFSQVPNTNAILEIRNTQPINPNMTEFDIYIIRNSQEFWEKFANGTYYLQLFNKTYEYNYNSERVQFELIDSPELDINPGETKVTGLTEYVIDTEVIDNNLILSILGPDLYDETLTIPNVDSDEDLDDTGVKIGRFRVQASPDDWIPTTIRWKAPFDYWQITSFKTAVNREFNSLRENIDLPPEQFRTYYTPDDNVGLINPDDEVTYLNDASAPDPTAPRYVDAKYNGNGTIEVDWKTSSELFINHFVLKRIVKPFGTKRTEFERLDTFFNVNTRQQYETVFTNNELIQDNMYDLLVTGSDEINRPQDGAVINTRDKWSDWYDEAQLIKYGNGQEAYTLSDMELNEDLNVRFTNIALGNNFTWIDEDPRIVAEEERGKWFCYSVSFQDWNGNIFPLGYDCTQIPNSVITFANAYPNPFKVKTQIDYELEDDVSELSIEIFDAGGRIVKDLTEENRDRIETLKKKGNHTLRLTMPDIATQGLYNLIIRATPLNDNYVRNSQAYVKLNISN